MIQLKMSDIPHLMSLGVADIRGWSISRQLNGLPTLSRGLNRYTESCISSLFITVARYDNK